MYLDKNTLKKSYLKIEIKLILLIRTTFVWQQVLKDTKQITATDGMAVSPHEAIVTALT